VAVVGRVGEAVVAGAELVVVVVIVVRRRAVVAEDGCSED
jgi:hypothetical protein